MSDTWLGLDRFNAMTGEDLRPLLHDTCESDAWVRSVLDGRPYSDVAALLERSDDAITRLDDAELGTTLAGHPRIGDRTENASWSSREQASMADAADTVAERIRQGNVAYEHRFGHVYLVCATGRSPEELLSLLERRLTNTPEHEHHVVKTELAAINRLRLESLVKAP